MDHTTMAHPAHHAAPAAGRKTANLRLATSATLHCLIGCGLGEIAGMAAGGALGWGMLETMLLGIAAGAIGGFALGLVPLVRAGFGFGRAVRQVLVAEGLSIAVMEAAEVYAQTRMPAVMAGMLHHWEYWAGMAVALAAGFVAAWPVNYWLVRRGVRHEH